MKESRSIALSPHPDTLLQTLSDSHTFMQIFLNGNNLTIVASSTSSKLRGVSTPCTWQDLSGPQGQNTTDASSPCLFAPLTCKLVVAEAKVPKFGEGV